MCEKLLLYLCQPMTKNRPKLLWIVLIFVSTYTMPIKIPSMLFLVDDDFIVWHICLINGLNLLSQPPIGTLFGVFNTWRCLMIRLDLTYVWSYWLICRNMSSSIHARPCCALPFSGYLETCVQTPNERRLRASWEFGCYQAAPRKFIGLWTPWTLIKLIGYSLKLLILHRAF